MNSTILSKQIQELAKTENKLRILQQAFYEIGLHEMSIKLVDLTWEIHDIARNLQFLEKETETEC